MITHKVGEIFQFKNEFLKVVEMHGCSACYFNELCDESDRCSRQRDVIGLCDTSREDRKSIQFINVETFK